MFRLMRNVHLSLGVAFFFVALLFAFSSIVFIYRPWFPGGPEKSNETVRLAPNLEARAVAMSLMREHGQRGEMRQVKDTDSGSTFLIWRPGTQVNVSYARGTGETTIDARRFNVYETLVQLHTNHGFWHDFFPANLWALLSLAVSVGLILLGASGIYLWYKHPQERRVGNVLIAIGVLVPILALIITRMEGS